MLLKALGYFLLFGVYGTSPFWGTFIWLYAESLRSQNSDYWGGAGWILVFAIPACAVTMLFAALTLVVYVRTRGSGTRKTVCALIALVPLTVTAVYGVFKLYQV
jgi:hypothetical protein